MSASIIRLLFSRIKPKFEHPSGSTRAIAARIGLEGVASRGGTCLGGYSVCVSAARVESSGAWYSVRILKPVEGLWLCRAGGVLGGMVRAAARRFELGSVPVFYASNSVGAMVEPYISQAVTHRRWLKGVTLSPQMVEPAHKSSRSPPLWFIGMPQYPADRERTHSGGCTLAEVYWHADSTPPIAASDPHSKLPVALT